MAVDPHEARTLEAGLVKIDVELMSRQTHSSRSPRWFSARQEKPGVPNSM